MTYNSLFISGFDRIASFEILFDINIDIVNEIYFNFMHELTHLYYLNSKQDFKQ